MATTQHEEWALAILKSHKDYVKSIEGITHMAPDTIANRYKTKVWLEDLFICDKNFVLLMTPPQQVAGMLA